jgi:hypothetical protein
VRPDIGSGDAVRRAVLTAKTLGYSTGPSGVQLARQFERWGIAEQIKDRIVQAPPGVPVGQLVAEGRVELGFQQLSELMNLGGIEVLGPLPGRHPDHHHLLGCRVRDVRPAGRGARAAGLHGVTGHGCGQAPQRDGAGLTSHPLACPCACSWWKTIR